MGQRLNLQIEYGSTILANAYFHWSGYTGSSMQLTKKVMDAILNDEQVKSNVSSKEMCEAILEINKDLDDNVFYACKLLKLTGADLTDEEIKYIKENLDESYSKLYDEEKRISRNAGLIAVSRDGILETLRAEEGRVTIDLESRTINFDAIWRSHKDEYLENNSEEDYDNLEETDYDFSNIPFDDFNEFYYELYGHLSNNEMGVKYKDEILVFIE